jgi:hypothetical protein
MAIPALAVLLAFIGSIAHEVPLGTGRTDEYLYPVLLLLPAAGGVRAVQALGAAIDFRSSSMRKTVVSIVVVGSLLLTVVLLGHEQAIETPYPGVAVQQLTAEIHHDRQPGDHIFVSDLMRYPWALYESNPLRIKFGHAWSTNFTVVSTDTSVFIEPSEPYEGDLHVMRWAQSMSHYHRLWYVFVPPVGILNLSYDALLGDGWHVARTLTAPGCAAYLLVRTD